MAERLRQEDHEIRASLGYKVRSCFKNSSEKLESGGKGPATSTIFFSG